MKSEKIKKIEEKIKRLRRDLKNVKGTVTEVYTRIVGYFRALSGWNKGKQAEYNERKGFKID